MQMLSNGNGNVFSMNNFIYVDIYAFLRQKFLDFLDWLIENFNETVCFVLYLQRYKLDNLIRGSKKKTVRCK